MRHSKNDKQRVGSLRLIQEWLFSSPDHELHAVLWSEDEATILFSDGDSAVVPVSSTNSADRWHGIAKELNSKSKKSPVALLLDLPFATHLSRIATAPEIETWLKSIRGLPANDVEWKIASSKQGKLLATTVAGFQPAFVKEQSALAASTGILVHSVCSLRTVIVALYLRQKSSTEPRVYSFADDKTRFQVSKDPSGHVLCDSASKAMGGQDVLSVADITSALTEKLRSNGVSDLIPSFERWHYTGRRATQFGIRCCLIGIFFFAIAFLIPIDAQVDSELGERTRAVDSLTRELAILNASGSAPETRPQIIEASSLIAALCQKRSPGLLLTQIVVTYKDTGLPRLMVQGRANGLPAIDEFLHAHEQFLPSTMRIRVEQFAPNNSTLQDQGFRFVASNELTNR